MLLLLGEVRILPEKREGLLLGVIHDPATVVRGSHAIAAGAAVALHLRRRLHRAGEATDMRCMAQRQRDVIRPPHLASLIQDHLRLCGQELLEIFERLIVEGELLAGGVRHGVGELAEIGWGRREEEERQSRSHYQSKHGLASGCESLNVFTD
jgi:hypothetical protein